MLDVEALQFTYTFKTYESFRSEEKDTLLNKYSALLGVSTSDEFENVYKDTYDYVMQTIYNYYDCYYLTSATKDRFLTLLGTILSGKLPNYKVKYDNYLDARNQAYNTLGGRKTTSSGSGSGSSSGGQKFASTPEVINSGVDYVDQYSTSENKYNNARNDSYNKKYDETLTASAKQLWENVKSIPDDIYKEVITITAKLFFSETMEERQYPCAYLTLTRRVQELGRSVITSLEQQINTDYELVTTLTTEGGIFDASTDLKSIVFKELKTDYDAETHKVQTTWSFRNGMSGVDTYTIPMSSLTSDGLMSKEQYSKLDQVVLYGTNFASQGEQYAVRQDADHDLYVIVPKGEVAIASADETGVVQLYANQLTYNVDTTLYTSELKVPVQMDARNKLFVEVPNYILPEATTTAYGGIKLFLDKQTSSKELTAENIGNDLPVQLDSNGKAFVNNEITNTIKQYNKIGLYVTEKPSNNVTKQTINYVEGQTITLKFDPNITSFSQYSFECQQDYKKFKLGELTSTLYFGTSIYTTSYNQNYCWNMATTEGVNNLDFDIDENKIYLKQSNGSITLRLYINSTITSCYMKYNEIEISYNAQDIDNSFIKITNPIIYLTGSTTKVDNMSIDFYQNAFCTAGPALWGYSSYSAYTGYVVINGKAYLL